MTVSLVSVTPDAEKTMAYCARVSSTDQGNPDFGRLLSYCVEHGHWSVFEMANMVVEIETSRAVAAQILRHRSFSFQEFSQRYAKVGGAVVYAARRQDQKNRQNSIDDLPYETREWFVDAQKQTTALSFALYDQALEKGIAKECARFLLPANTLTRLYMNGTVRSWIHYLTLRAGSGTQAEHTEIATAIKAVFVEQLPVTARALGWDS